MYAYIYCFGLIELATAPAQDQRLNWHSVVPFVFDLLHYSSAFIQSRDSFFFSNLTSRHNDSICAYWNDS